MYTYTHTHIHTHPHTYTHRTLPTKYYSCHSVISRYHKSHQHYFLILLNYKNLEIHSYKKNKISK